MRQVGGVNGRGGKWASPVTVYCTTTCPASRPPITAILLPRNDNAPSRLADWKMDGECIPYMCGMLCTWRWLHGIMHCVAVFSFGRPSYLGCPSGHLWGGHCMGWWQNCWAIVWRKLHLRKAEDLKARFERCLIVQCKSSEASLMVSVSPPTGGCQWHQRAWYRKSGHPLKCVLKFLAAGSPWLSALCV